MLYCYRSARARDQTRAKYAPFRHTNVYVHVRVARLSGSHSAQSDVSRGREIQFNYRDGYSCLHQLVVVAAHSSHESPAHARCHARLRTRQRHWLVQDHTKAGYIM